MLTCQGIKDARAFKHSSEGSAVLESIRTYLEGQTIRRVTFAATEDGIATTLHLDNHESFRFQDEDLALDTLYEQHSAFFWQRHHPSGNNTERSTS
ncbi:hypothetical protein LDC_1040 [sediment metagenome]|uniref:Uncharacterized protein n=1 Tax=sediment metagenome TaxID=749907 RepID=D9PHN8_9ZZZZ